jgi:hypothetical protein
MPVQMRCIFSGLEHGLRPCRATFRCAPVLCPFARSFSLRCLSCPATSLRPASSNQVAKRPSTTFLASGKWGAEWKRVSQSCAPRSPGRSDQRELGLRSRSRSKGVALPRTVHSISAYACNTAKKRLAGRRPPYFAGSSLILLPPFATGMTQIGVAASAELRSDV